MNALLLMFFLVFGPISPVWAEFTSNVSILKKADITKLTDEALMDAYEDVLVELEAIKTFHTTSGFTPKQYDEYRRILKYRLQLLMEVHTRNLDLPLQMER